MIDIKDFLLIKNKDRKDNFGEVFTHIDLVADMLLDIPKTEWSNLNTNFFDPTCGDGYFLFFVYDILMGNGIKYKGYENIEGLKNIIKNEKDREKHIIENMIYGTDIQEDNIQNCKLLFNSEQYKVNFLNRDFLSEDKIIIGFDILTDFNLKSFKNIVGNPPFQALKDGKRKAKNHNLWRPIILKSFEILEENGIMSFVCPSSWMSLSKANKDMFSILRKNTTLRLNIDECKKYFPGVGNNFSFFSVKKNKNENNITKVLCKYKTKIYESTVNMDIDCLPLLVTDESLNILKKTIFKKDLIKYNIKWDSYLHAFTKKKLLSKEKDDNHQYMLYHTTLIKYWSEIPHKINQNKWKILIPRSTYFNSMFIDFENGTTQGMGYLICENEEECIKIKKILTSSLYKFIVDITRWGNWNSQDIIYLLPELDSNIEWTDKMIYDYFNLSEKEINLIEENKKS
jgi:hypothetical protein